MNNFFEKIKYYYQNGLWDFSRVQNVYEKGIITKEEFEMILASKRGG